MAKLGTFQDDFDTADAAKWDGYATRPNFSVVDGQLHAESTVDWATLDTVDSFDLTDSHFAFELVQYLDADASLYLMFYEDAGYGDRVWISISSGEWGRYIAMGSTTPDSGGSVAYNPLRHKWVRLRESSGTMTLETSRDGATWVIRHSVATPVDVSNVAVRIAFGSDVEGAASALLDNFNLHSGELFGEDEPLEMELLQDTFDEIDPSRWYNPEWETGVYTASSVDGKLVMPVVSEDYRYLSGAEFWNLEGSYFCWELVQNANRGDYEYGSTISLQNTLYNPNGDQYELRIYGGNAGFRLYHRLDGVETLVSERGFVASEHKWFRVREADGDIYLETSHNGATWSVQYSGECVIDPTEVKTGFVVGSWEHEDDPGTVIIDNLNYPNNELLASIGWYVGKFMPLGGRKTGTVQPRNFFEEADWLWNQIPEDPVLDPLSDEIANSALHDPTIVPPPKHTTSFMAYGNALVHPYMVKPDTPRYFIYMDVVDVGVPWEDDPYNPTYGFYDHPFPEYGTTLPGVPIPYGIQVPPGSDCHMTVADPVTGKVFSMWQVRYKPETDQWRCTYGGISDLHGDGRDGDGSATATNISRYACQATIAELQAGEIPHALFVISNACTEPVRNEAGEWIGEGASGTRYPAQKSDGFNYAGSAYTVDQGSRLQLDPSIDLASIPGISKAELAVGRCWQRYGAYVLDSGGSSYPPLVSGASISELWQGQDYPLFPFGEWGVEIFEWGYDLSEFEFLLDGVPTPPPYVEIGLPWDYYAFTKIPWAGNIRVLKHWHGGETL